MRFESKMNKRPERDGTVLTFSGVLLGNNDSQISQPNKLSILLPSGDAREVNQMFDQWNAENPNSPFPQRINEQSGKHLFDGKAVEEKSHSKSIRVQTHWIPDGTILEFAFDLKQQIVTDMKPCRVSGSIRVKVNKKKKTQHQRLVFCHSDVMVHAYAETERTLEAETGTLRAFEFVKPASADGSGFLIRDYSVGSRKTYRKPSEMQVNDRVTCCLFVSRNLRAAEEDDRLYVRAYDVRAQANE